MLELLRDRLGSSTRLQLHLSSACMCIPPACAVLLSLSPQCTCTCHARSHLFVTLITCDICALCLDTISAHQGGVFSLHYGQSMLCSSPLLNTTPCLLPVLRPSSGKYEDAKLADEEAGYIYRCVFPMHTCTAPSNIQLESS